MIVLIVHKVRPSIRGRLTRWLIQPHSGVYVGHPSARIREQIWKMVREEIDTYGGSAILIHPAATEQGCRILTHGQTPKTMVDFEGIVLPKTAKSAK